MHFEFEPVRPSTASRMPSKYTWERNILKEDAKKAEAPPERDGKSVKYVMGIQSFSNQDSGAALIRFSDDGAILDYVAISEERLIRKKYPYVFPVHSVGYCMDFFGLSSLEQVDLLVTDHIRIRRWFNSGPTYNISEFDYLKLKFAMDPRKIRVIGHHMAHAASAFYTSGFDASAILVIDGNGSDLETTSYFEAEGFGIELLENYKAHGIGAVYTAVTKNILSFGTGGEGKTMGLAPYGAPHPPVLHINAKLDGIKNSFSGFMRRMPYSDVLNQLDLKNRINPLRENFRRCDNPQELLNPYFSRVAYDVQLETERVLLHLANDLFSKTHMRNLCIAGGVGLNSVSNKIILDRCGFENLFIFPACSDAGIPFGLALWGYYNCREFGTFKRKKVEFRNAYTGIPYSDPHIRNMFAKYGIPHKDTSLREVAQHVADGKIVGWFQGGSEYGPRALGHRSILADSRRPEMKDILNSKVKHREAFRPFAPSVLLESSPEYFDLDGESPYMLLIAKVKKPDAVPSITHVDHTARVQTVTREANDVFYDLIREFGKLTGVNCILNTSFNDAGEPIVETPEDAMICFLSTDMDYLVLQNFIIDARDLDKATTARQMMNDREQAISARTRELLNQYFPGYDAEEKERFVREMNKISEWYTKYKCKYELEKKILEWNEEKKRILIVGTKSHTSILPKFINEFWNLDIVGFIHYRGEAETEHADFDYPEYSLGDLQRIDFDQILVSSYEYNFEIAELLDSKRLGKPIYRIYDNTSRDFLEILTQIPSFKAA